MRTSTFLALWLVLVLAASCASIHDDTAVEIERPAETAWAVFADAEQLDAWLFGLGDLPWIGEEGVAPGSAHRVELREEDEVLVLGVTVTELVERRRFAFDLDHDWMLSHNAFRVEPLGPERCRIHWDATIHPKGFWRRCLVNLWRPAIGARYGEHLEALKELIEAEPGGPVDDVDGAARGL
jgi:uncharacterized protein YndB with AHSA1/START domain